MSVLYPLLTIVAIFLFGCLFLLVFKRATREKGALVIQHVQEGNIEKVKKYIHKGADINVRDSMGRTPLIVAVIRGNLPLMKIIINGGADVIITDRSGMTAMDHAKEKNLPAIIRVLKRHGGL